MRKIMAMWLALAVAAMLLPGTGVTAQEEGPKRPAFKEERPGRREAGGRPMRQRFEGREARRRGGPAFPILERLGVAVCANERFVYVVKGNTLYQFRAEDLSLLKKAKLEEEPRPGPRPGGEHPAPPPPPERPKPEEKPAQPPAE